VKSERAGPEELAEVITVLSEAAKWVHARGIEQWPDPFPPERVEEGIARGETYLARIGPEVAGTITLQWEDPFFWGERPPNAAYVHLMAVRWRFAGRGTELLEWAAAQARAGGRELLRLDCLSTNPGLRRYYEAQGFVHLGDRMILDHRASLYEKAVM
jgi:GNAT superfamily N-acetyltransferase